MDDSKNIKQTSNKKEMFLVIFKKVLTFLPKHVKSLEANLQTCQTCQIYLFEVQQWKHQNNVCNLFKVKNGETGTMSVSLFKT